MVDLKLGRLPDRTPVKLAITITPDLQSALNDYAALYAQAYGREEPVTELIPAMLAAFLESDRNFVKARERKRARAVMIERAWEQKIEPLTVRISTAVRITGLSRSRIYELIQSGDLDTVKVGRATLVQYASLTALTANRNMPDP